MEDSDFLCQSVVSDVLAIWANINVNMEDQVALARGSVTTKESLYKRAPTPQPLHVALLRCTNACPKTSSSSGQVNVHVTNKACPMQGSTCRGTS